MIGQLTYKHYRGSIEYDEEDKIFLGQFLNINDIICYHGTTITELSEHFESAIDTYIETKKV